MENPKLSFASPYSYSLFQGEVLHNFRNQFCPQVQTSEVHDSRLQIPWPSHVFFSQQQILKLVLGDESKQNPTTQVVFMQGKGQ